MVNYKCQRCGYCTNRKSAFKSHLLRKNLCKIKLKKITRYGLLLHNGFDEEAKKIKKSAKSQPKVSHPVSQNGLLKCKYCNKLYKHKQSKWKHEQKCKINSEKNETQLLKEFIKEKDNLIKMMFVENKKKDKKIDELMKQLIKLSEKTGNTINTINSHNKITINAYGCENLEYITNKLLKKLVNKPGTAIPNLLKIIHFNDDYPENKNLKVTNIHDPYIKVHDGADWQIKNKGDIIEDIIITKRDILEGAIEESTNDKKIINKLEVIDDVIEDKNNKLIENSIKDILINSSND